MPRRIRPRPPARFPCPCCRARLRLADVAHAALRASAVAATCPACGGVVWAAGPVVADAGDPPPAVAAEAADMMRRLADEV